MSEVLVVGHITVKAPDKWKEYRRRVPATLEPWGAELVFRGRRAISLAGELRHADIVVIRFPDLAAAKGWHASPAYQALVPLREAAADVALAAYQAE
jgi:uncharacterized protein (DUF1330 family)